MEPIVSLIRVRVGVRVGVQVGVRVWGWSCAGGWGNYPRPLALILSKSMCSLGTATWYVPPPARSSYGGQRKASLTAMASSCAVHGVINCVLPSV